MKNTMVENHRLDIAEGKISENEDMTIDTIQNEIHWNKMSTASVS